MRKIRSSDKQNVTEFIGKCPVWADVMIVRDTDTDGKYVILSHEGNIVKGAGGWRHIDNAILYAEICGVDRTRQWVVR